MSSHTTPRRRMLAHPATLTLAAAGSSTIDLAEKLGVTPAAAGMYLRGERRPHPGLADALRSLIGDDQAKNVLALIPATRGGGAA